MTSVKTNSDGSVTVTVRKRYNRVTIIFFRFVLIFNSELIASAKH